ncbi:MAG: hypothetical protein ACXVDE_00590 [Tumebacillaceae bacterium]
MYWTRNPLRPGSRRRIQQVSIVGSARPCAGLLMVNRAYGPAARCLVRNGFRLVYRQNTTSVSGFSVFVRMP